MKGQDVDDEQDRKTKQDLKRLRDHWTGPSLDRKIIFLKFIIG